MRLDCCEWLSLVILQEFLPISTHSCKITNSFPAPSTVLIKIRLLYIVSPELILFTSSRHLKLIVQNFHDFIHTNDHHMTYRQGMGHVQKSKQITLFKGKYQLFDGGYTPNPLCTH